MGKAENYVEGYLRKRIRTNGWLCYKFVSPQQRGVPDDVVIANGLVVFVECKSREGHLSELQELCINHMLEQGADVRVVYTRSDVDRLVDEISRNPFELSLDLASYMEQIRRNPESVKKIVLNVT